MQHLATVIFRIHHIRAGNPDSGRAMAKILGKSWGLHERPILQGFATLAADSAHGSIASSFAISFASRVV